MLEREREREAGSARRMAADGLVTGTAGNVSMRTDDLVAVTPTGARLEDVTSEQIAVVALDGYQVEGNLAPTSELGLHLGAPFTKGRRRLLDDGRHDGAHGVALERPNDSVLARSAFEQAQARRTNGDQPRS